MRDLKKTVASYLKKRANPDIDTEFLLFLLNQSRDQLERYLKLEHGFERLPSGSLVKGNGPIVLTAHMDTENAKWFGYQEDSLYPFPIKVKDGVVTKDNTHKNITPNQRKMSLGGDDRCGIYAALKLFKKNPENFTLFFTDQEEEGHGHNTAEDSPTSIWEGKFVICLDSDYKNVFSYHTHLEKMLEEINKKFGFTWEKKSLSNVHYMKNSVGINLGMGYAKQHSPEEYIVLKDLDLSINYVLELVKKLLK